MPTTLELAVIEVKHDHHARSMMPQLRGSSGDPDRAAFAEGGYDPNDRVCFEGFGGHDGSKGFSTTTLLTDPDAIYYPNAHQQEVEPHTICRSVMIRTTDHKLVWRPGDVHELYDLSRDPGETQNVYGRDEHAAIQTDLTARLLDWLVHTSDVTPFDRDDRNVP